MTSSFRVSSSQSMACSPCTCFHHDRKFEYDIICRRASLKEFNWNSILRFNLDIVIEDVDSFNFDMIPYDVKPLVSNLTIRNTVIADLDASGFQYLTRLNIENVTVKDEEYYLMPTSLKVSFAATIFLYTTCIEKLFSR